MLSAYPALRSNQLVIPTAHSVRGQATDAFFRCITSPEVSVDENGIRKTRRPLRPCDFGSCDSNWPQAECADAACPPVSIIRPPVLRTVCNHPIQSVFCHIKGNGVWLRKNFQPRLEGIRWLSVFAAGGGYVLFSDTEIATEL